MAMQASELEALLREALPDAEIHIQDLAGDGDHYKATIRSAAFAGKSRVAQHQLVYAALKGRMGANCTLWPSIPGRSEAVGSRQSAVGR